jgi:HlyD family secretion protein
LDAAQKKLSRSQRLVKTDAVSQQVFDDDQAAEQGAQAAVSASKAQLAASEAAISASKAQVVDANAAVDAARAAIESITADINDSVLKSPRDGRVQYRVAQPGEVLAAGGRVLNMVDLSDVYMTFFLPTAQAGRVAIGSDVHIVLDAVPQYRDSGRSHICRRRRTIHAEDRRDRGASKARLPHQARISPELLKKYILQVKTGLPGVAYVKLDPNAQWPPALQGKLLQ